MFTTDESLNYGITEGCPVHGDEYMRECSVCGNEFCAACFSSNQLCKDCAAQAEEESSKDFDDVENVNAVVGKDEFADVPKKR